MTSFVDLGSLPFNIGTREVPTNAPFPDELPFAAAFDDQLGAIAQVGNSQVAKVLERVYARGSQLGTPMGDYGLGKATCEDFIGFLLGALQRSDLKGVKLLEIGCGTGFLLSQLHARGAAVLGIEPGARSSIHADRAGVPVMHQPFESTQLKGNFDLVVHTGVMEHVTAPLDFLGKQLAILADHGRIALVVPDCGPPIHHGDISMFVHEHWSYFTMASLTSIVTRAGGQLAATRKAGVGGAIYAVVARGSPPDSAPTVAFADAQREFAGFAERASRGQDAIRAFFASRRGQTLGVYCPGRFLNYWTRAGKPALRFFDDDRGLHGRYFPPIPFSVETREQLLRHPVDSLLIMSRTFGEALAADLRREPALHNREIMTVAQLF